MYIHMCGYVCVCVYIYAYIYMHIYNHFTVKQKLSSSCKSTILQ